MEAAAAAAAAVVVVVGRSQKNQTEKYLLTTCALVSQICDVITSLLRNKKKIILKQPKPTEFSALINNGIPTICWRLVPKMLAVARVDK